MDIKVIERGNKGEKEGRGMGRVERREEEGKK